MKKMLITLIAVAAIMIFPCIGMSGDLDDGISKYTDDGIGKYDDLGKADRNIKYIVLQAKSKASYDKDKTKKAGQAASGDANMNSVVLGAGSNVRGDIIIIDQSKGDKTNVAD